jgi:hypothetical protein
VHGGAGRGPDRLKARPERGHQPRPPVARRHAAAAAGARRASVAGHGSMGMGGVGRLPTPLLAGALAFFHFLSFFNKQPL